MSKNIFSSICDILMNWYECNKRDLPWRDTQDPYKIWISEIILQQTRVSQGYNYFLRFLERFPNINTLAEADEDEVLKYWQGLGYYSRARNLHKAAKKLQTDFPGSFPKKHDEILKLPGIGKYTAAAISSFAFNDAYAVVDGNVYRVLARLFGIETAIDSSKGQKEFSLLAQKLLDKKQAGLHNQAIMEFGALQCTPTSPDCNICPLIEFCEAFKQKKVAILPKKEKNVKTKKRYFNYLHITFDDSTFLTKREGKDIWQGLYEFPLIESSSTFNSEDFYVDPMFTSIFENTNPIIHGRSRVYKHILSHQIIEAVFIKIGISSENNLLQKFTRTKTTDLSKYPIARLTDIYLNEIE